MNCTECKYYSYTPARVNGPPEDCYPAEDECTLDREEFWENGEDCEMFEDAPDDGDYDIDSSYDEWKEHWDDD